MTRQGGDLLRRLTPRYGVVLAVAALDQASKAWALDRLFTPPAVIDLLPFLRFVPVWNDGVSFGLLGGSGAAVKILLTIFALAVAAVLPFVARDWDRLSVAGAVMMAGGALGNGIDRVIHGRVVDFIDVFAGQYHWPAFNAADACIVIGVGVYLVTCHPQSSNKSSPSSL